MASSPTPGSRTRWKRSPPATRNRASSNSCPGTSNRRQAEIQVGTPHRLRLRAPVDYSRRGRSCGARPSPRPSLPRAVRSAPPATQSPWRLRSAGFPGVDLPIFHTARIDYPTGRAGLGFHTPRIDDAGVPWRSMSCLFGAIRGQSGPCDCWTERMSVRNSRMPCPCTAMPRNSRMPGAKHERNTSDMRVLRPGRHDWHPLSVNETRAQCAGFWDVRPGCARPGARPAQSGASPRSDSWNARASATSASSSFWRPSRSIASRLSVARNQV